MVNIGVLVQNTTALKKDIGYRVQIHSGLARIRKPLMHKTTFLKYTLCTKLI